MAGKLGTILKSIAAVAGAIAVVSLVPPLTEGSAAPKEEVDAALKQSMRTDNEYGYCVENMPGIDCECFAKAAGQVLNNQSERAAGWTYADPWRLAEMQASQQCS